MDVSEPRWVGPDQAEFTLTETVRVRVPQPGETVWREDVLVSRRWVSPEIYLHEAKLHAEVLRELFVELNEATSQRKARPLQKVAAVRWVEPAPWRGPLGSSWFEAVASLRVLLPEVVGADQPALRIVHEGLRDVLDWLGWPSIQGSEEVLARG